MTLLWGDERMEDELRGQQETHYNSECNEAATGLYIVGVSLQLLRGGVRVI